MESGFPHQMGGYPNQSQMWANFYGPGSGSFLEKGFHSFCGLWTSEQFAGEFGRIGEGFFLLH